MRSNPHLQIHFCVLLWGFTAILGKLISLPAHALVVWRMALVCGLLVFWPGIWRRVRMLSWRHTLRLGGIGLVVALHWLTFYGAIKLSNASVAAACLALGAVFAALIEPMLHRVAWRLGDLLLGLAAVPGVWLLMGGVPLHMHTGIIVGIASAFLTALFSALNKREVAHTDPAALTLIELGVGGMVLAFISVFVFDPAPLLAMPSTRDLILLLLLAAACTLLPFILSLHAMRHISAFETQLALNLEPVYAILIATAFLGESRELDLRFYLGTALVVMVALARPVMRWVKNSRFW